MLSKEQKDLLDAGKLLPLMEAFYTIQGEGFHTGKAAYFIRVGGCDVGCHWCDVKESWNPNLHPLTASGQIINDALPYGDTVVITGGEPLTWNMDELTGGLKKKGKQIHLETSGAYPLSGHWDWICLSPKKTAVPHEAILSVAHELKVIVYNKSDFDWAEKYAARVAPSCKLFLQPEWSRFDTVMPLIVDYVLEHPQWNVSLQSHKYMHIP